MVGFEPTFSCARGTRIPRLSHTPIAVRLRLRTKLHPAGVEPAPPPWRDGTLPLRHECVTTSPEAERAVCAPHLLLPESPDVGRWAGRRSNPSLLVFSQALHHLSYQPMQFSPSACGATKKPGVLFVTPGFVSSRRLKADVTCAEGTGTLRYTNRYSPNSRQSDAEIRDARVALRDDSPIRRTTSDRSDRIWASAVKASCSARPVKLVRPYMRHSATIAHARVV
jgi:hypothetical protein